MNHEQAIALVPAYLDRELGPSESLAFEQHLAECEVCRHELGQQQATIALIRASDLRQQVPDDLLRSIRAALPATLPAAAEPTNARPRSRWPIGWRVGAGIATWLPAGMMAFGTLALAGSIALYLSLPVPGQGLTAELVDSHVRSLQMDHTTDVTSTDRHTVKPWFNGKLDFAPPVIDLADHGYPLTGGRLDYLDGRRVAVLVYRYNQHPINLYVWPDTGADTAPVDIERHGYRITHWRQDGMAHWAITDAGQAELDGFVKALREPAA
jgi:anti-sigma factor RsiW